MSNYEKACSHDRQVVDFYLKMLDNTKGNDVVALNNIMAMSNQPKVAKMVPTKHVFSSNQHLVVNRENAMIDAGIASYQTVETILKKRIAKLQASLSKLSKNKAKKAKKAIGRLKTTVANVDNLSTYYFSYPVYKTPRVPSKSAIKYFFENYRESLGTCLLPSERIAVSQQHHIENKLLKLLNQGDK